MFSKDKTVGSGQYKVTKKVTDWETVGTVVFWGVIGLVVLANL